MRLYTEDPAAFEAEFQTVGAFLRELAEGKEPTYGQACDAYLATLEGEDTEQGDGPDRITLLKEGIAEAHVLLGYNPPEVGEARKILRRAAPWIEDPGDGPTTVRPHAPPEVVAGECQVAGCYRQRAPGRRSCEAHAAEAPL